MSDLENGPDLDALRRLHKRIAHCRYNGQDLVFRKPTADEAQMYRSMPSDTGDQAHERVAALAQFIVVYPPLDKWHTLIDDYPFMLSNQAVNEAISIAMGVAEEKKDSTSPAPLKRPTPTASPAGSPSGSPSSPAAS
jgi:hypothetical protein